MNKDQFLSLKAPDGTRYGDMIPKSNLYRSFCGECGEPMRVSKSNIKDIDFISIPRTCIMPCEQCNPQHIGVGNQNTVTDDGEYDTDAYKIRPRDY